MKNDELLAVGRKIRSLREALNLSQETMAQGAGLDRAYYGGIERGERNVSTLNLIEIARALNVEVGDLFPKIAELRKASHGRQHTT
jgi:transcriptional regulator with XRE-family HTH domain